MKITKILYLINHLSRIWIQSIHDQLNSNYLCKQPSHVICFKHMMITLCKTWNQLVHKINKINAPTFHKKKENIREDQPILPAIYLCKIYYERISFWNMITKTFLESSLFWIKEYILRKIKNERRYIGGRRGPGTLLTRKRLKEEWYKVAQ